MQLGLDSGPAEAVRAEVGPAVLRAPVVRPEELDVAISRLVRRLQESSGTDDFMSAAFDLPHEPELLDRKARLFAASVKELQAAVPATHRVQNRLTDIPVRPGDQFTNTSDTDPAIEANREWAKLAIARSAYSQLGSQTVQSGKVPGPASLETVIHDARDAAKEWEARGAEVRGWILHQAANALSARRGDLVSVMAAEAGKTISEADTEISSAIDFAHFYAESARRLEVVDGARFVPDALTVVVSPWSAPVAVPAGSVLAALSVGSAVIIKAAPQTRRCAAVMVEALWQAGVPREVLRFVTIDDGPLSKALVSHSAVDRVLLTGRWETAQLFRSWRPDLPLHASTSGKNAIVITPSADLDLAVADLVASAFGHAGQTCSAVSLAIVVGSVADSESFRRQLIDAVTSLRIGMPDDLGSTMGPVVDSQQGTLADGLTTLDDGESWLVAPQQLSSDGRLWSPGVRTGVLPGSRFHTTEYFGPVLGIMHASSLAQAIAWQNATESGLAAGIHSLDGEEVGTWIESVEAGNLYVNRGITGAIVQRQPFGGWKRSSVGATAKAGGPNYLTSLGTWHPRPLRPYAAPSGLAPAVEAVLHAVEAHVTQTELAGLRAAAASDDIAWDREYGRAKDISALGVERNLMRYVPTPVTIRFDGYLPELARVLLAAARVGAPVTVSSRTALPEGLASEIWVEGQDEWLSRAVRDRPARIRLVGTDAKELAQSVDGDPEIAIYSGAVTPSGRIEALPFLLEQSISITNHRSGSPHTDPRFAKLLPR